MKAVILAAGVGSRLRPITSNKPKCLVRVVGRPILDYQIKAYASAGVKDILIVVGYQAQKVREYCKHIKDVNIKIIENTAYETTENMYSLYLAMNQVGQQSFILSNGDVVFDAEIAYRLINSECGDVIVVDVGAYSAESMKVTVDEYGYINDISKKIPADKAFGSSIDVYRFSDDSASILFERIRKIIEEENNLKDWTEVALQRLLSSNILKMRPFDTLKKRWIEIDDYEDLILAEKYFSVFDVSLKEKKLCFLDLDGTVYFLSNNSSYSKRDYVDKLRKIGINAVEDNIILSTDGLIEFLVGNNVTDVFVVGTESMQKSIARTGINTEAEKPEYVVLGYDTELTYRKLSRAAIHLFNGADLIATHCDVVCPTPEGPVPDIGSILALLEKATGKIPVKIFGKPNPEMVEHVMLRNGVGKEETMIVGDRTYTDMEMAKRIGCDFILVLSGESKREDIEDCSEFPDLSVKDIGELLEFSYSR
jgi:HAD superfamily hydrolase (TIGR01450 family)